MGQISTFYPNPGPSQAEKFCKEEIRMRNLKRALSLTLASVMLLGMMVIGTSAAAGYDDVKETDNVEAIEVLQAVEVMVGDDRGFGPDRPVTRAEMAVVMGKLLNLDYNYYVSTCPFADVSGNFDWAKGWVGACAANGIVSGRGDGIYDPAATVTAVEAASMMMRALGYFKHVDDYADGFQVVTVRQGSQIGIFNGVGTNATNPMTRNQVAQMALNALRSEMVDFTGTLGVEINGVKVGYQAEYTSRTSTEAKYNAIEGRTSDVASDANHKGQYYVQLGEELYDGKLRLNNGATDAFGRPSRHWEYDGKAIGTYVKKELMDKEWVGEVTGKDLYDQLGKATLEDKSYDFFIYVDGEDRYSATDGTAGVSTVFNKTQMNKNNKAAVGGTGTGVLTQVFVDVDNHDVTIAVINTYLARAKADYNEKRDEASFNVYAIEKGTTANATYYWKNLDRANDQKETLVVSDEDFPVAGVKENDSFLVTVADGEIQSMVAPEVISSTTLDSFKRNSNVVSEGTTYNYTTTAQYNVEVLDDYTGDSNYGVNLKDKHYNIYLDAYDNLIGIDLVENADNYVFITGVDSKASNLSAKQYDANAIFLDGTMKTITFDNEKSAIDLSGDNALLNTWCTYTVSGANEIYTLKEVQNPASAASTVDGTALGVGDSYVGLKSSGNKAVKVGQYHDLMNNVDANSSQTGDINIKRVSLRGAVGASRNEYKYVYGNDATVYLNTEVKNIYTSAGNTDLRGVITKVSSVTSGIKNANLEVMTKAAAESQAIRKSNIKLTPADVAYGAYVLYNDKGYVIAAVTVADDSAASENLVYVHTGSLDLERYSQADDEWTWQRRVVSNGEEITLTEVGDSISQLKKMNEHNWYVVTYNADGEVIGAAHALDELATKNATKHCDDIATLENTVNTSGVNTVLYEKSGYDGLTSAAPNGCGDNNGNPHTANSYRNDQGPKLENNTFFDITTATTGFYVNDDVKVVFVQKIKNVWTTEISQGKTDLQNAIDALIKDDADKNGDYYYEVSAVLNNGRADVVVIRDLHTHGDSGDYETPENEDLVVDLTNKADVKVKYTSNTAPATEDAVKAVREKLVKDGFTVDEIKFVAAGERGVSDPATDQYEFTVSKGGIPMGKYIYKSTAASAIKEITVKVNGTDVRIAATTNNVQDVATLAGSKLVPDNGTWVKTKLGGTEAYKAYGNTNIGTFAAGDEFEFGYYKVTVTGSDITAGSSALTPVLKSGEAQVFTKKINTPVEITLTGKTAAIAAPGYTITSNVGTVTAGAHVETLAVGKTADVTVTVPASAFTTDVTITLSATAYVADVTMKVTYGGVTKTITVPETATNWNSILAAVKAQHGLDWAGLVAVVNGKVRLDSDWSKGEAVGAMSDAAFVTGGKLNNNLEVTFGCVEMGRGTDATALAGTGAVVWTANDAEWSTASEKRYMLPGETITVAIDLSKLNTKITVGAGAAPAIGFTTTAANSTVAVDVKDLAGQNAAADTTALTGLGFTPATGNKSVTITGVAANNVLNAGVITFTITVGSTADAAMALSLTNT